MKKPIVILFAVLLLLASCAPQPVPPIAPEAKAPLITPVAPLPTPPAREPWEAEWEQLVEAAKKEGKVVIYSSAGYGTRFALGEGFKQKFGIQTEWVGGRGPEIAERLMTEWRAGLRLGDIMIGGHAPGYLILKPAGVLDSLGPALVLPEVTDPKGWFLGRVPWIDKDRTFLAFLAYPDTTYTYNTQLVKPEELRSYVDLLNPKWKGKMVMDDPTFPGSGGAFFIGVSKVMGLEYLHKLVQQEPFLTRDRRLLVEWVARGKYPIGLAPHTPFLADFQEAGAPIEVGRPVEGAYVSTGSGAFSLAKKAPHPNAAKVFINWALTKEPQIAHTRATLIQSFRDDIPVDYLAPVRRRDPNMKYFVLVTEEYLRDYDAYTEKAKEVFRPLKK